jgi:glycosyltransferase involved in cell wall biosynthesis
MATTISVVILTKNEEKNIKDCIQSLEFCDEIIILDDYSTDKTLEVVKRISDERIKSFQHHLNQDFSQQRNLGLSKATCAWVLFVDADERVPEKLKKEIEIAVLSGYTYNGYFLKRQDVMWGKKLTHGETANITLLRLAKKDVGVWKGPVHETWNVKGKVGELSSPLEHYPHQTLKEFIREIDWYSSLRAKELHNQKIRSNFFSTILYPKVKFIQNYFLRMGFLDGIQGFLVACVMSLHSFLVRAKLYQLNHEKQ